MSDNKDLCPAWCLARHFNDVSQCKEICKTYQIVKEELKENPSSRQRSGIIEYEDVFRHN